jgi:hypothetical protein
MHVQQLCVRFTDELVTARKEQAALLLAQSSSAVSKQLQDLMEKNDHLINKVIEQQELLGNQSIKMKEFSDKFDVMQDGVTKMQDGVTHTTNNFHSIEAIIGRVTRGYSWFTSFIHFLVALNVVWLLTMNKRSRKMRSVIVNMVMLETLFEILSHWAVYNNYLRPEDQVKALSLWRRTFMMVELFAYIVFLVVSSCFGGDDAETGEESTEIVSALKEQMKRERAETRKQMEEHNRQMAELWMNHQAQGIGTRGTPSTNALMADPFETMRGRQQQNHQQNSQLQLQHHRQYHRARSYSPVRPRNHCRLLPVADIAPTIGSVMIEANVIPPPPKTATNLLSAVVYDHAVDSTRSTSDSSTSTRSGDVSSDKEGETVPDCGRKRKRTAGENTEDMDNPPRPDDDTDSTTAVKSEPDEIVHVTTRSSAKKKKKRRG